MSKGRDAVRLSEEEVADFLAANMKVQVGTIGRTGAPHLSTLFYVLDEGRIAFWTYRSSQKVVNLRRDSRITCLVDDGEDYLELRGVSIQGRATLVEEYDEVRALGTRVLDRMARGADSSAGPSTSPARRLGGFDDEMAARQAHKRVGVIVEPDRVASWDHRKLTKQR